MASPHVAILRAPGTNCDAETAFAFARAGAESTTLHINELRANPERLRRFQILVIPGGFSYGDDVGAGKILATQLEQFLADAVREFRDREKLILGVCNGFQTLLKAGLLTPPDDDGPLTALGPNASGRYEDRWADLAVTPGRCQFLRGISRMAVPVAHGEGRFVCRREWILQGLVQAGQVVMRYTGANTSGSGTESGPVEYPFNPNGSQGDVAGICDATGRVLGMMPHPERNILPTHRPGWTRRPSAEAGDGMRLFENAVAYFKAD